MAETVFVANIKTHILCSIPFFPDNRAFFAGKLKLQTHTQNI